MLLSNNMDISVYDIHAQSSKSYHFNLAKGPKQEDLEDSTYLKASTIATSKKFESFRYVRPGLDDDTVQEIKQAFDLFDKDGSGRIDPKELV